MANEVPNRVGEEYENADHGIRWRVVQDLGAGRFRIECIAVTKAVSWKPGQFSTVHETEGMLSQHGQWRRIPAAAPVKPSMLKVGQRIEFMFGGGPLTGTVDRIDTGDASAFIASDGGGSCWLFDIHATACAIKLLDIPAEKPASEHYGVNGETVTVNINGILADGTEKAVARAIEITTLQGQVKQLRADLARMTTERDEALAALAVYERATNSMAHDDVPVVDVLRAVSKERAAGCVPGTVEVGIETYEEP